MSGRPDLPDVEDLLSSTSLLRGVGPDSLTGFRSKGRVERFRSGSVIFRDQDPSDAVYFLLKGRVRVMSTTADGRTQLHAVLQAGQLFGELGVVGRMGRTGTAETLEDAVVWRVGADDFLEFLAKNPNVALELMEALARQVVTHDGLVEDLLFLDLRARVAKRLLALVAPSWDELPEDGTPLPWDLTQTDIANLCGGSRENVNRILADFQRRKLIAREGRRYLLTNVKTLKRIARV